MGDAHLEERSEFSFLSTYIGGEYNGLGEKAPYQWSVMRRGVCTAIGVAPRSYTDYPVKFILLLLIACSICDT